MQIYSCEYKKHSLFFYSSFIVFIIQLYNNCKPTFAHPSIAHKKKLIPFIFIASKVVKVLERLLISPNKIMFLVLSFKLSLPPGYPK